MKNEKNEQRVQVVVESLVDGALNTFEFIYKSFDFISIQAHATYMYCTHTNAYVNFEQALNEIAYAYLDEMGIKGNIKKLETF